MFAFFAIVGPALGGSAIHAQARPIPEGLIGEIRRTVAGTRLHIDHHHEDIEFDLVVGGTGSYTVGGLTYQLNTGTLLWLGSDRQHRLVRSPRLEMWVVNFRREMFSEADLVQIGVQPSRVLPGDELVDLDRLLGQVALDSDDPATYNSGLAYVMHRALRASRDCPPAHVKMLHPAVTRALMLLREKGADFSLSRLAEESGIAATYLSRLLVEQTNRSFVEWRNRIRLERFIEDFRPGANLLHAAMDAGFGSYARFYHVFTQIVGCTPNEWAHRADHPLPVDMQDDAMASAPALPSLSNLGIRRRWMGLVPFVSPQLRDCFGQDFIGRLVTAIPLRRLDREDDMIAAQALSPDGVNAILAALRERYGSAADDLDRLIMSHDFAGLFSGILRVYDLTPGAMPDEIAAFILALWTALRGAPDPSHEQVSGVVRQVAAVTGRHWPQDRDAARALHTALVCHFVVIYHALQAARAGADGRGLAELRATAAELGDLLLGEGLADAVLTNEGFRAKP